MIVFLREKFIAQIFIIGVLVLFSLGTLLLFDQIGNPFSNTGQDDVVLKLGGAKVKRSEFERLVANETQRQQQQSQGRVTVERKQVEQNVINLLVQRQALLSTAQISNAEVERYIQSDSSLVTNYNLAYQYFGSGDAYRDEVRLQMSFDALRDNIQGLELVTDIEAEKEYRRQNDKAKFKYIQFQYHEYNDAVKIEDADAQAYFEKDREKYKTEDQINLKFVKINPSQFVKDNMVRAYYDSHKQEYTSPEVVKARHILKKFPDNATDEQKAEVKAEAEKLLETVKAETAKGTEFAELAKQHSDDTGSAPQGGALRGRNPKLPPGDYFAKGDMVKPFETACFETLKPGEISEPIESQFGYHIIKLEEKKPESVQSFELVQAEIREKLVQIDGAEEAKTVAEELLFDVEINDYEKAVKLDRYKDLSLIAQDTGLFAEDENNIPKIGSKWTYRGLIEGVFDIEVNVSDIVDTKKPSGDIEAYFVVRVLEKKPGAIPDFATVKDKAIEDLRQEKARKMAVADAQELLNRRSGDESFEDLAKKYQAPEGVSQKEREAKDSNLFTLTPTSNYISGMGSSREAMLSAFDMELNALGGPFEGESAAYIVQLVERQEPDIEKFQSDPTEKNRIRKSLLQTKQNDVYTNWVATLTKQTPKWVHPDYR